VDSLQNITYPIGMSGVKVGANFHIITGDKNAIRNINRSVEKSGLRIHDLVLQPLASAAAVMCDLDFEAGVAIVDIGGGTTDLAVFYEGILKHTAVIPYGGENITNDIKNGLGVLKTQAEQMKVQFGYALADEAKNNAYITIPGLRGQNPKEISVKNLAHIIQARMSEILDFVVYHLKQIGMDNKMLNGGIILTGGGSQLKHLIQLTEYTTGVNARIGYPNEHLASGHIDELTKPMYATCVGLILKGYNDYENDRRAMEENYVKINTSFIAKEKASNKAATGDGDWMQEEAAEDTTAIQERKARERNASLKNFLDRMKTKIIDMFTEEEDAKL
jgi:cell division protein FtsA